jgi:hypothetical protein
MRVRRTLLPERREERGQTIIFVALALVSLLAMAALAIDIVTLYVAKSEAQRAADAAALAGATAFVSAGATTYPPSTPVIGSSLDTLARAMANSFISASLAQNNVSGSPPQLVGTTIDSTTYPGNPHITVTVQQTNLPTFFARIWGTTSSSVQATATAEAYNSSSAQNSIGSYIPVSARCVKPILVLNRDPSGNIFVSTSSGSVNQPALPTGYVGDEVSFSSACGNTAGSCNNPAAPNSGTVYYVPAAIPAGSSSSGANGSYNSAVCPGDCQNLGGSSYQQSIACCDTTPYNFNQCGVSAPNLYYDLNNNPDIPTVQTQNGLQCVVHTSGGAADLPPDVLTVGTYPTDPFHITPGTYTRTALGVGANTYLSTSDSIVTLPIIDTGILSVTGPTVRVLGFLQVFIANVPSTITGGADFDAFILNVVGCGNVATSGTISGGGVSAVPVRLITPP